MLSEAETYIGNPHRSLSASRSFDASTQPRPQLRNREPISHFSHFSHSLTLSLHLQQRLHLIEYLRILIDPPEQLSSGTSGKYRDHRSCVTLGCESNFNVIQF